MADTPVSPPSSVAPATAPSRTTSTDPLAYSIVADTWAGSLAPWNSYLTSLGTNVKFNADSAFDSASEAAADAAAAAAASNATLWVSGGPFVAGDVRYSPINFLSYRCKVDNTGTTDPSLDGTNWAPLVSSGGLILLSTVSAAISATVDIDATFDSNYDEYEIRANGIILSADTENLLCRLKIGGTYLSTSTYSYWTEKLAAGGTTNAYLGQGAPAGTSIAIGFALGNAAGESAGFVMRITRPSSTSLSKLVDWKGAMTNFNGGLAAAISGFGANQGTAALTGVQFLASTGTITSGTFSLYGIAKS